MPPLPSEQTAGRNRLWMPPRHVLEIHMNLDEMIAAIRANPRFPEVGMILCHNGVVRATSRDGRPVDGLRIAVDHAALKRLVERQKAKAGIMEILVHIRENQRLAVGEDVMYLVVAGDIRERVLAVLQETLDAIKTTVTQKEQYFVQQRT